MAKRPALTGTLGRRRSVEFAKDNLCLTMVISNEPPGIPCQFNSVPPSNKDELTLWMCHGKPSMWNSDITSQIIPCLCEPFVFLCPKD